MFEKKTYLFVYSFTGVGFVYGPGPALRAGLFLSLGEEILSTGIEKG